MELQVYAIDGVTPVVDPTAFVHPTAVLIGDVIVGPRCYVGPGASLRGDMGRIEVHEGSNIQDNCVLHCFPGRETVVGEDGHVGHGSVLHGCRLEHNVLVGMNAVIMDGAEVGESSIIGAQAFIKAGTQIPARSLVAGIPGKVVREVSEDEIGWKRQGTRGYQRLAERSRETMRITAPLHEVEPNRGRVKAEDAEPLYERKARGE